MFKVPSVRQLAILTILAVVLVPLGLYLSVTTFGIYPGIGPAWFFSHRMTDPVEWVRVCRMVGLVFPTAHFAGMLDPAYRRSLVGGSATFLNVFIASVGLAFLLLGNFLSWSVIFAAISMLGIGSFLLCFTGDIGRRLYALLMISACAYAVVRLGFLALFPSGFLGTPYWIYLLQVIAMAALSLVVYFHIFRGKETTTE